MHHKPERNPLIIRRVALFLKPLRGVEENVCVKSFVKTCYHRTIQLYCCPSSNRTALSEPNLLVSWSQEMRMLKREMNIADYDAELLAGYGAGKSTSGRAHQN